MKHFLLVLLSIVFLCGVQSVSIAQVPRTFSYQGVVADAQGQFISDGAHNLSLSIYEQVNSTTAIYTENHTGVVFVKGIFNVMVGSKTTIPSSLGFDKGYFLGVSVDGGAEMTPRTLISPVPNAMYAQSAGGLVPGAFGAVTSINGQQGEVTLKAGTGITLTNSGSTITINSSSGAGIGTEITTIYGRIVNESGSALAGVSVSAGTATVLTNANGLYILKDVTVPKGRAVVIAKKTGYFNGAKAEVPSSFGATKIELSMMSNAATSTIPSSAAAATVNITGGGSITFAAGSFMDASGASYTGQVKVSARYLDPRNANFFDYFPGDNMAQATGGNTVSLISCGALRVEIKDPAGNTLKLDPSKPATLSIPKPIDTKAPAVMPLWYFDESIGMWKEEGVATLAGGNYSGTVTHFTTWNLDYAQGTSGTVSIRVVCGGIPMAGIAVSIVGDDASGPYFVHPGSRTGPDGRITFLRFPANRPTQIDIVGAKNNGLFYVNTPVNVNLGTSQSLNLGDISLNSPCPGSIIGTLECNGTNVDGLVTVSDGSNFLTYSYTNSGNFGIQVPSAIQLTVNAINASSDPANTMLVPTLAVSEQKNIGNIGLCGSGTPSYLDIITEQGSLALSPDGSRLAVVTRTKLTVYDAATGNSLSSTTFADFPSNLWQFNLDGSKLLISSNGGSKTDVYDVSGTTSTLMCSIPSLVFSSLTDDGLKIIARKQISNPFNVIVYSTLDGSVVKTLTPIGLVSGNGLGYIQSENAIVYNEPLTAHVWSVENDVELRNFSVSGPSPLYILSSEDGHTIATNSNTPLYSFYNTMNGEKITDLTIPGNQPLLTKGFAYHTTTVGGVGAVKIMNLSNGTSSLRLLPGTNSIDGFALSRNEQYLAAGRYGKVRIWKIQ